MTYNLHSIVRGAITNILDDEDLFVVRNLGMTTDDEGHSVNQYAEGFYCKGQVQNLSDASLFHANMAGQNSFVKRIYLCTTTDALPQVSGIQRHLARSGDYIRRYNGTWWLVDSVQENYAEAGWECLRVIQQIKLPKDFPYETTL